MRGPRLPYLLGSLLLLATTPPYGASLLELYEQALANSPALKAQEYAIDQAQAQKDQVRSKLLPQVLASGNLNWNEFSQDQFNLRADRNEAVTSRYQGLRGVIQARLALFDLPSWLSWQGADASVRQSEMDLETARMSLAADLVDRYFQAVEAGDQLHALLGERNHTEGELQRIRKFYEKQLVPVTDLYEIEAYWQTLLSTEIELQNAQAVALEKLRELVGAEVREVEPLNSEHLPDPPDKAEFWVQEAGKNHPALQALQHAIDAAEKLIASSRAQHLPQLALQASETYADNGGFDNRQQGRYTVGSVGLQLNVPIFSGGGIDAAVREAAARHQIAIERRQQKLREIERETRTAFLDTQAGRSRIKASEQEVVAREKAQDAQQESYQLGVSTIVALLEAKKNLLRAHFERAKARYRYIRSLVALRLWAGTLAQTDIEDINRWLVRRPTR
jgi:outer membrane protein